MGIYGISHLVIFGGVLLLLHNGAADSSTSFTESSRRTKRQESHYGASAIHSSTHLFNQKTQLLQELSQKNIEREQIVNVIDTARLKIEEVISMEQHRDSSSKLAGAQLAFDALRDVAEGVTLSTTTSRQHVTETDIEAEFGTRSGVETLTETGSHVSATTTPSEIISSNQYITETDLKAEFGTRQSHDTLTEHGSKFVSATTQSSDLLDSREHVTETNLKDRFGTTQGSEILTEIDTNHDHRTTTSSETLTEMDAKYFVPTTTVASEVLTESRTGPAGLTTDASDILTESAATTSSDALQPLTESASKSATAAFRRADYATESAPLAETTTKMSTVDEAATVALSTDGGIVGTDFRIPHTESARIEMTTEADSDVVDARTGQAGHEDFMSSTSPMGLALAAGTDSTALDDHESNNDDNHDDGDSNSEQRSEIPLTTTPAAGRSSIDGDIGAVPLEPQTVTAAPANDVEETNNDFATRSPATVGMDNRDDGTTGSLDIVTVLVATTDEVTTSASTTADDVVTQKYNAATTPETLEESEMGVFRCKDGTVIGIKSLCDGRGDCPDFSDEDMCDPDEKANLTRHSRPAIEWNDVAPPASRDDTLISLDDSRGTDVEEVEQSHIELPTTFKCATSGTVIPISAVCDGRADCEDYSDEYDCSGKNHVTEAMPATTESPAMNWTMRPKADKSLAIEVLSEEEEDVEFFRCLDGSAVIPMKAVCDKKWDCLDFSDEDECDSKGKLNISKPAKPRPSMSWATPPSNILPDRETNMIIEEISDTKGTLPEFWRCENGNYIFITSVCDKKDDCGDFSDEDDCVGNRKVPTTEAPTTIVPTTAAGAFNWSESGTLAVTTPIATTIEATRPSLTLFADSNIRTWDDAVAATMDIVNEDFPVAMFQCNDGEMVEAVLVCDNEIDCFDGSDEDGCYDGWYDDPKSRFAREVGSGTGPTTIECGTGFFQCDDETCISESAICDGVNDCLLAEDESDTYCADACPFPTLNDRVVLLTGSDAQSRYQNGSVLELACTIGSDIVGDSSITCISGTFTDGPECLRNCHIDARTSLICASDIYMHGTNPDCSCDTGYNLIVASENTTCEDTAFIPSHPQCEETNECLSSPIPCDTNADCFNMPLGSYTCICLSGYEGDGTTCTDIDECALNTDNCDADATCNNTAGSFTCMCNTGFIGDGVTSCVEPIYFDYGTAVGDTDIASLPGSSLVDGYAVSGALQRRTLFPVGSQLYSYLHITNTGYVVFSNILSVDLSEFSHPSAFNGTAGFPAVGVFGIESQTSSSDATVYYQIYESTNTDSTTTSVLTTLAGIINDADTADTQLTSPVTIKWAMIVTWENLRRFGTFTDSPETNTFQAIFATDGIRGFVVLLYEEDRMLWNPDQLQATTMPMIGYRSDIGFYDLQTANGYTRAQMFRPDGLAGNVLTAGNSGRRKRNTGTYRLGKVVFRLDTNPDSFVNPAEYCLDWYDSTNTLSRTTPGVLPCPCTRLQAMSDRRFQACTAYTPLFGFPEVEPYPASLTNSDNCVQQVFPASDFSGSRCVYYRNESLIVGYNSLWESSHMQSAITSNSAFSFLYLSWSINDVLPRHYCCSETSDPFFCDLYEEKRPRRSCNNYQPVGQGWGQGDPHITTLDGFQYTFNGLGEYTLVRIESMGFELQARTEKARDGSGAVVDTGTVFTGFAASHGETKIEFILHSDRTNVTILVNGTNLVDPINLQTTTYESTDPLFSLRYDATGVQSTGDRYIATWRESATSANDLSLIIGFNLQMLDFTFQAPELFRDSRTTGLYGIWNGDATDDIVSPDGSIVSNPYNLTDVQLFDLGQLWNVNETTTLFTYLVNNTWTTFNGLSFTPMFLSDLESAADADFLAIAQQNCSNDQTCLFDALATNDISVGANTMMIGMTRQQEVNELGNFPPILSNITEINGDPNYPGLDESNGYLTVIIGRSYMFQAEAIDPNGDAIEYTLQGNTPANATLDPLSGILTWTPSSTDPVQFGILASDGTVARFLQMTVVVCYCANNGTCDMTAFMVGTNINNDKFAVAQCDCAAGWSGADCSNDFNSCLMNPCYPGVSCLDNPPPSILPSCSACPTSLTGDGFQCWDLDECMEGIDGCEQICSNTVNSFICSCYSGYELQPDMKSCRDINECDRMVDDCDTNAQCNNTIGSYTCTCNSGFRLEADNRTCTDIDECSTLMPCATNADCGNLIGSYTCTCRSGYQGDGRTCEDINECFNPDMNECSPFASCTNYLGYFVCDCLAGYQGSGVNCTDRNECSEGVSQCSTNADCVNIPGSFMCSCDPGFMGDGSLCVDVDECTDSSLNDCDVNALCTNTVGGYTCACNAGFSGNGTNCTDIDECEQVPGPCSSSATCTNQEGSFLCTCDSGYMGDGLTCTDLDECQLEIDDCSQSCVNVVPGFRCACEPGFQLTSDNTTCEVAPSMLCDPTVDPCTGGGMCLNATGLITCVCPRGYNSTNATNCEDTDECALMTDSCDMTVGVCSNTQGGYSCSCRTGYSLGSDLRTCSDINECDTGVHNCSADATCTNTIGGFTCVCNTGYEGDGITCADVDECDASPCGNNSACTNTIGSFDCECVTGYTGNLISGCMDVNECLQLPCDSNADCMNTIGSFQCACRSGYNGTGLLCEDFRECDDPNRCPANSDCRELVGSYTCICRAGYRGDGTTDCVDIDECAENPDACDVNALCTNFPGNFSCECDAGYAGNGTYCSDVNECELGTIDCDANSNCTNLEGSYTCFCQDGYFDSGGGRAGPGECIDVDECALQVDQCDSNSVCINTNGSYRCECASGFMMTSTGVDCEDILECSQTPSPCDITLFRVCVEQVGSYECVCQSSSYEVNGVCEVATTLFLSASFVDIKGIVVAFFFDTVNTESYKEALANDTRVLLMQSPTFSNILDINIAVFTLRTSGDVVDVIFRVDVPFTYTLTEEELAQAFEDGLTGLQNDIVAPDSKIYMETNVIVDDNECSNMTLCPNNSMCVNTIGSYFCQCNTGYTFITSNQGLSCGDVDECALGICSVNADCTNYVGGYTCTCTAGFEGTGLICTDINECSDPDICGPNANCTNTNGNYTCACDSGFMGNPPAVNCTDIDECLNASICTGMNEECSNLAGSYECDCRNGTLLYLGYCLVKESLTGTVTFNSINDVMVVYTPDLADPTSAAFMNMSTIVCNAVTNEVQIMLSLSVPYTYVECNVTGFTSGSIVADFDLDVYGETRMEAVMRADIVFGQSSDSGDLVAADGTTLQIQSIYYEDPANVSCTTNPCLNNGTCVVDYAGSTVVCQCAAGYSGTYCEINDACIELGCVNNSTCENLPSGDAVCRCLEGYNGTRCEEKIDDREEGVTPGLSVGVIVGIVLGGVAFVLLVILACFCCVVVFAARRRRQRKQALFEGESNLGFGGNRRYYAPAATPQPGHSRGGIVRNAPSEFSDESSDNFYFYQNIRGRPFAGAADAAPPRQLFHLEDDDDDSIDSRFSGIVKNMWNMHADQRPDTTIDPRQLPTSTSFLATGGIPRATVHARNLLPDYRHAGGEFERPYVADGTESNAYSDETEEFRQYRGRPARGGARGFEPYNYF